MSATKPAIVAPPWSYAYTIIAIQTAHSAPLKKNRAIACRRRSGLRKTTVTALRIWRMCLFTGEVPATSISCSQVRMQVESCAILSRWQQTAMRSSSRWCASSSGRTSTSRRASTRSSGLLGRVDAVRAGGSPRPRCPRGAPRGGCRRRAERARCAGAGGRGPRGARGGRAAARRDQRRPAGRATRRRPKRLGPSGGRRWPQSDAADTVARMRERVAALAGDEVALKAEAEGLAVEAQQVAREVAEVPRLSDSGRSAPGTLTRRDRRVGGTRACSALRGSRRPRERAGEGRARGARPGGGGARRADGRRERRARAAQARGVAGAGIARRPLREARVVRPQVERAAVAAAFRQAVVEPLDALVREIADRAGLASGPAPCRRRGRAAGRARRPPGGRSTPSRPRCARPRRWVASWASTRDRERGVVTGTDLVLERDPVQRAADRRLEEREPARDERDTGRVGADPRERVAVVAADRDRVARDPGRLRREAPLGLGLVGRRDGRPAGVPVDAVGVREQARCRSRARRSTGRRDRRGALGAAGRAPARPPRRPSRPSRGRRRRRPAGGARPGSARRRAVAPGLRGRRTRSRSLRGSRTGARTGSQPGGGRRAARARRSTEPRCGRQTEHEPARSPGPG